MCFCLKFCKVGKWRPIRFSAANFTGNGTMTWTVTAPNVVTLAYMVIGKTMTIAFEINDTSVGGAVYTQLLMTLPAGVTATRTMRNQIRIKDNGVIRPGNATVETGNNRLIFAFNDFTASFGASTNATSVNGEITFEFN